MALVELHHTARLVEALAAAAVVKLPPAAAALGARALVLGARIEAGLWELAVERGPAAAAAAAGGGGASGDGGGASSDRGDGGVLAYEVNAVWGGWGCEIHEGIASG